ncbi:MAG: hypothetical protein IKH68_04200, partial [Erysipelotrichaceae bacterium]|nr:hypothetical protein [Erysipelotrichaceae bacterium]
MAEKKTKKYVAASEESKKNKAAQDAGEQTVTRKVKEAQPVGNPGPLRFGAVALWVLALVFEVLALLVFLGKVDLRFMPQIAQLIAFLVLDLIAVIIGAQLWKKANHIDPVSEA